MQENATYTHHISRILKVLVYIEEHLDETLALEKLAKIAHISPFYFHRLFRAYVGEPLADYVRRLRLQKAAEHLRYTKLPITDIALEVGYETPSSFTKTFNQVMGKSPRQYRKAMQPWIQMIMKRTLTTKEEQAMIQPEFVNRSDETVLFVRKTGDYRESPWKAFQALNQFLKQERVPENAIKTFYSVALDDPNIVDRARCRFDACAALSVPLPPKGEVGKRTISGGRFAVFVHKGPYHEIEQAFDAVFRQWYPTANVQLEDAPPFCEHLNMNDPALSDNDRITKLYIPLKSK